MKPALPLLAACAQAALLSLAMLLAACGGGEDQEPQPPKAQQNTVKREWSFWLQDDNQGRDGKITRQKEGTGVVDDWEELGGFHVRPDDVAPPAQLRVYSDETGMTYWVMAQTFDDLPDDPQRVIATHTTLDQRQYFVKQEDNATLRFVVSDALIELIDRAPDLKPRIPTPAECGPGCAIAVNGVVELTLRAYNSDRKEYFFSAGSVALADGYQQDWTSAAVPTGDGRAIWKEIDFVLEGDVAMQGHGDHARYRLKDDRVIEIPLSHVNRGERFVIHTKAYARAIDYRHRQTYASAYLRDPQSSSGLGIQYTGLQPVEAPAEALPPYVSQPAPACSTPNPDAGVLQFKTTAFSAVEAADGLGVPVYITRTQGSSGAVSAHVTSTGGSATAGTDYTALTTHVKFEDGETGMRLVFLPLLADDVAETDETITLQLSDARCAMLGPQSSAVLTILDNDTPAPTPITYTVGGSVVGLVGSGLVLEEIKTGKRVTPPNGSFVFDYAFPDAAPYEVRIVTQPTHPMQSCSLANASGTIASANVSNVAVTCSTPLPNGALDPSFGQSGKVVAPLSGGGVAGALQADGKIVVVGGLQLMRFNPDGSLDGSFGGGGTVNVVFNGGLQDKALGVAVQPDGKILVVGFTRVGTQDDFAIARYLPSGEPDPGFGTQGRTSIAIYEDVQNTQSKIVGAADRAHRVLVLPDGDLLLAGHGGFIDETIPGMPAQQNHFAAVRLNSDGTRDAGFGGDGVATGSPNEAGGSFAYAAALTADGKLVVGGKAATDGVSEGDLGLVRFNAGGQIDATFGPSDLGWVTLDNGFEDQITDMAVLANGWIAVAARSMTRGQTPLFRFTLVLFDEDGHDMWVEATPIGPGNDLTSAIALQADGKILLAGEASAAAGTDFGLVRHDTIGRRDPGFGTNGVVTVDFFGGVDAAKDVLVQPDGQIVLIGVVRNGSRWDLGMARVLP